MAENLFLTDEEQDKENSPPFPIFPVSERPTRPPVLLKKCPFKTWSEKVLDYVCRIFTE